MRVTARWAAPLWLLWSAAVSGHDLFTAKGSQQAAATVSAMVLIAIWLLYTAGLRRQPARWPQVACFHAALLICVAAVFGPLDEWAEQDAAAHMSQHMLLMVIIPPLWVASQPLPQMSAGGGRAAGLRWLWGPWLHLARHPLWTAWLHGAAIWFWHLPRFYALALENPWWHIVEHACFLFTAGLFWWAVLRSAREHVGWALLAVLFTLMHTGFLGALLTFAQAPLYLGAFPPATVAQRLAEQQLAGLIMWVAGGIPYLLAAAWIALRWYRQLVRRMYLSTTSR